MNERGNASGYELNLCEVETHYLRLASQPSPFSLISRINTGGEKGLVLERSVIGHVMPGLVGVVDRVVGAVDHMTDNICVMEPFPARASLIR